MAGVVYPWVAEIPEIHEWLMTARPRERFVYFKGYSLTQTIMAEKVRDMVYKYAQEGLVYLGQTRDIIDRHTWLFMMVKASNKPAISLIPFGNEKVREWQIYRLEHKAQVRKRSDRNVIKKRRETSGT